MSITGNKGEWSELYTLIKLLAIGRLYAADQNTNPLPNIYFPIKKIFRKERDNYSLEYHLNDSNIVDVYLNGNIIKRVNRNQLIADARDLFYQILQGNQSAFEIPMSELMMQRLACEKIKASSADKTDITMLLHDIQTGFEPICGFSIKSELGHAPTLLNASNATNFRYKVENIPSCEIANINGICSRNKIIDRIQKIYSLGGHLTYDGMINDVFKNNLCMIDSKMDIILSYLLLHYYRDGISTLEDLGTLLDKNDPLNIRKNNFYSFKLKKFLCAIALGLNPATDWDGHDEANGGYIIVTTDGNVLAYHIYNRDSFESYLLKNTKLERASTSRHNFASIYSMGQSTQLLTQIADFSSHVDFSGTESSIYSIGFNENFYMNLNLQVRFR